MIEETSQYSEEDQRTLKFLSSMGLDENQSRLWLAPLRDFMRQEALTNAANSQNALPQPSHPDLARDFVGAQGLEDRPIAIEPQYAPPSVAPEKYAERPKGENAEKFVGRVYGRFLTGEFTRADLNRLDPQALIGVRNFEREEKRRVDLYLPTLKERNDKLVQRLDPDEVRASRRLEGLIQRRRNR